MRMQSEATSAVGKPGGDASLIPEALVLEVTIGLVLVVIGEEGNVVSDASGGLDVGSDSGSRVLFVDALDVAV